MKTVRVAAAILLRQGENGTEVLAAQRGYGTFEDGWEFPGGKIEPGESGQAAVKRELREEMAADIEVGRLYEMVTFSYPEFDLQMECYLCRLKEDRLVLLEHKQIRWLPLQQLDTVAWLPADCALIQHLIKSGQEDGLR